MIKRIAVAFAGLALIFGMSACTSDGVSDPAYQTLRYEGGDTGGSKFKECVEPGEKLASNDRFYSYPTTQRESVWDTDTFEQNGSSADYTDLQVFDRDGREVNVKMKISFMLNTSCEDVEVDGKTYPGGTIQAFHELIGKTRNAYFDTSTDGNGSYGPGWLWAMNNYISTPAKDFVTKAVRPLSVEDLYNDTSKQEEIERALAEQMPELVNSVMETDLQFYENFTVSIYAMNPDAEYLGLIKERENAQIKAETAQKNAEARVLEAQANEKIARAEAEIRQAEIKGYGGFENYNKFKAVENGLNPYQPTYIVGGVTR